MRAIYTGEWVGSGYSLAGLLAVLPFRLSSWVAAITKRGYQVRANAHQH